MELGFLSAAKKPDEKRQDAQEVKAQSESSKKVSTGKSEKEQPEIQQKSQISDIQYDQSKGKLDLETRVKESQRVARLKEYATENDIEIVKTLKEAITKRANGNKCCTIRELDILCRSKGHFDNPFLNKALNEFGAFLSEDTITLDEGVFELRSGYNKGLEWTRLKRSLCTSEKQAEGDKRLEGIKLVLSSKGLPLFADEEENGFDPELLKPEYMDWPQFEVAIQRAKKFKSLATKDREQQEKESVKTN